MASSTVVPAFLQPLLLVYSSRTSYTRSTTSRLTDICPVISDLIFILVSTPHSPFAAHGHKLLIISPIIEGLLGGWSTLQGATTAYVSDCTSDGSRAQIFSRFSGVFYLGFSLGPMIGAYLIRHPILSFPGTSPSTSGPVLHNGQPTVTSVFYVAAVASFVNLLLVVFLFPESISKKKTLSGKPVVPAPALAVVPGPGPEQEPTEASDVPETSAVKQSSLVQRFLGPLALLAPKQIPKPEGGYRTDWSLTILGVSLFMFLLATVSYWLYARESGRLTRLYRVFSRSSTSTLSMSTDGVLNRLVHRSRADEAVLTLFCIAELLHHFDGCSPLRPSTLCHASSVAS